MLRLSSVSAGLESRSAAVEVLVLGLLWCLAQISGSMPPLLPHLLIANAGNEPLISVLSNIDLYRFTSSHPNCQVPDLKEYLPFTQHEASSTANAI
jgi:hypothetical protein